MRSWPQLLFPALAIVLFTAVPSAGTLISSSELQLCARTNASSSVGGGDVPCDKKFVVAVTLDGGQNNTEEIVYWQSSGDASSDRQYMLEEPVKITFAKSRPVLRYALTYERNFNAKPRESTVYTSLLQGCHDEVTDGQPTCGRAFDSDGAPVPYSEGFCCSCDACELFGLCSNDDRGNTRCALLNTAAAAACLVFDDLWYSGYRISQAETWYELTVTVEHARMGRAVTRQLRLGPDRLAAVDLDLGISARLVGDFAAFVEPPNLEDHFLFVPSVPTDHPRVLGGLAEWMLVPRDHVTVDGRSCNRIGVSYEGFTTQPSRCEARSGSCLHNQLLDFRLEDEEREANGRSPRYALSARGAFELLRADSGDAGASARPHIALPLESVQGTLIVLTFAADNMSYTVNTADGLIIGTNSSDFEALTGEGFLSVGVLSTGDVVAEFFVEVTACTVGTFEVPSQTLSIPARHVVWVIFRLRFQITDGVTNAQCNVTLRNALFRVVDSRAHHFNVTARQTSNGAQGGAPAGGTKGGPALPPQNSGSSGSGGDCTDCPFYNPLCFVMRQCFWQIIVQIVVVALIIAAIVFVVRHRRKICCCLYESREEREERLHRERLQREEDAAARRAAAEYEQHRQRQRRRTAHFDDVEVFPRSPTPRHGVRVPVGHSPARHVHHHTSPYGSPQQRYHGESPVYGTPSPRRGPHASDLISDEEDEDLYDDNPYDERMPQTARWRTGRRRYRDGGAH